ncbi:MAG: NAD-dependent epimerase/dehydratase family protein [PVC group bacterium]
MKRALITGIAGFAGRHLARDLVDEGWEVTGIERHGAVLDDPVFLLNRVRVEECDILGAKDVGRVIRQSRPDVIFHLAGTSLVPMAQSAPQLAFETNTGGSLNILDEAGENAPDARVILISSAEVYGKASPAEMPLTEDHALRPANVYGLTKLCAETAALYYSRERGLDVVVLRPFNHIGPGRSERFWTG